MEMINEDGFLEELLALRRETCWETNNNNNNNNASNNNINNASVEMKGYNCCNNWGGSTSTPLLLFDDLDSESTVVATPSSMLQNPPTNNSYDDSFSSSLDPTTTTLDCSSFADFYSGYLLGPDPTPIPGPGDDDDDEMMATTAAATTTLCKAGPSSNLSSTTNNNDIIIGSSLCMEIIGNDNNNINHVINNNNGNKSSSKVKKVEGQPSKNLMAERRRRKRLNDRLSMLRSVVPKISKMDRTSILGDTIDYMKELLERINNLQEEADVHQVGSSNQFNVMTIFKDVDNNKPNDVLVRNSPKFDVERRNLDTRVEICCAGKPGLLLSTVTTLEAFGLEIQQCVISCFNDFSLQASCSEEMEQRSVLDSEDIKQALFRNAGYLRFRLPINDFY